MLKTAHHHSVTTTGSASCCVHHDLLTTIKESSQTKHSVTFRRNAIHLPQFSGLLFKGETDGERTDQVNKTKPPGLTFCHT